MHKRYSLYILAAFALLMMCAMPARTMASAPVKGTFVNVTYDEVQTGKDTFEKRLKDITIENSQGRTTTLRIDAFTKLTVDSRPVKIEAFKLGMDVEADVNLRRVTALRGSTGTVPAVTDTKGTVTAGLITELDPKGKFMTIQLDDGRTKTYFLNSLSKFYKGTTLVTTASLHEGDRVKITTGSYTSNRAESVEIIAAGIQAEALYKGKIQRIDGLANKLIVKDEQVFRNWLWWDRTYRSNSSYSFSAKTPIYVGDEQIRHDRLRYYANHDVYYVTVKKAGKEVIEKMVIKSANERIFNEPLASVNGKKKEIGLRSSGTFRYHDGTIMIRNGRLIDAASLQSAGTALVVTEGKTKSDYANVIHIANDGMLGPNMTGSELYYGRLDSAAGYTLSIGSAYKLEGHGWSYAGSESLPFSNDTVAVQDRNWYVHSLIPQLDLKLRTGEYGYFYVKDGHVTAAHLVKPGVSMAGLVSVGRLEIPPAGTSPAVMTVENVSQWKGYWAETGRLFNMDIEQATILKDGKVISPSELKKNDRLFIVHESGVKGRIILVD